MSPLVYRWRTHPHAHGSEGRGQEVSPGTKPCPASRGCCDPQVPELPTKWRRKWVGSAAVSDLPPRTLLHRLEFCFSCQTLSDASINPPVPWHVGKGKDARPPGKDSPPAPLTEASVHDKDESTAPRAGCRGQGGEIS